MIDAGAVLITVSLCHALGLYRIDYFQLNSSELYKGYPVMQITIFKFSQGDRFGVACFFLRRQ